MKTPVIIFFLSCIFFSGPLLGQQSTTQLDFFGQTVIVALAPAPKPFNSFSPESVQQFTSSLSPVEMQPYLDALLTYRHLNPIDDWLFYQLVRKVAQTLSPKADNYYRYTLYKWWLLVNSGYDARLIYSGKYLLLYVQSNETLYNIPFRLVAGKQYVCLNYHDYVFINFTQNQFEEINLPVAAEAKTFSYKVTQLPHFKSSDYTEHAIKFEDRQNAYELRIKLNPQIKTLFINYPVVDYSLQFNMPLSEATHQSLITEIRKRVQGMKPKEGVDFLMRFTRYAFLFKPDGEVYGSEKRLSPEQTLLSEYSDCEDRSALFFYLVKEIYNLPMLVLTYPSHVTVAVQFDKAYGQTIAYMGGLYTVCEPSPQRYDLNLGQLLPELRKQAFEIAYAYRP